MRNPYGNKCHEETSPMGHHHINQDQENECHRVNPMRSVNVNNIYIASLTCQGGILTRSPLLKIGITSISPRLSKGPYIPTDNGNVNIGTGTSERR